MRLLAALALVATAAFGAVAGAAPAGAAPAGATDRPARTTGTTEAGPPPSCRLLKTAQVTAAMDQPAGPGNAGPVPEVCAWPLFATSDHAAGSLYVFLERGAKVKRDFALASDFNAADRVRLTGLGRRAFYAPSLSTVWVLENRSTLYYVQGIYPRDATPEAGALQDSLVRLAKQAEARI
jgi:hypothetical protein